MKLSIALFFFLSTTILNGQSVILLEEDSVFQLNENADLSNNFAEFPLDLFYGNNTNDTIMVNWRREFGDNCPMEWQVITIDPILSYHPMVDESPNYITMAPGDSHFILRQSFVPRQVAGCCDIRMMFSLEGDPNNPIDTGYYHIEINSNECSISTAVQKEVEISGIKIYPNPSANLLKIENISFLESIEIFDSSGKRYYQKTNLVSNLIDLSSFPSGMYVCKIKSKLGGFLTTKILKL